MGFVKISNVTLAVVGGGGGWTPDRLAGYTHFYSTVFSRYTEAIVSVVT